MNVEKVAVVGATGYSGEELVRLLMGHPRVELVAVTSRQQKGQALQAVYPRFTRQRYATLQFSDSDVQSITATGARIVFLALPHGVAAEFAKPLLDAGCRVIDLSADFRIKNRAVYEEFYGGTHHAPELARSSVYGMPEIYREQIRQAELVACPGCYPTSIVLPLYPLARERLIDPRTLVVTSMSGVSGAGRSVKAEYLFAECNESVRAYGVPKHRHLAEIEQELTAAYGARVTVNFIPHLIPVTRGIHSTICASLAENVQPSAIAEAFTRFYGDEAFVRLLGENGAPDTKHVTHTNFVDIGWRTDPRTGRVIVLSAEDNLMKGAAGQAVQCLNVMCGWPETTALA